MKVALVTAVLVAALAVPAAAAPAGTNTTVTCVRGGRTTVTGITSVAVHFRFRWWYSDGSSYLAAAAVWPDTNGVAWIPTRGAASQVSAIEHRGRHILAHIRVACS